MMGDVTSLVASEVTADKLRSAERARFARMHTASVVGPAAMRRQHSRVLQSLVLVTRRRESGTQESE